MLTPLIDRIMLQHLMLIKAKQITIKKEIDAPVSAWVNSGLFEVVFRNLLANAIKFTNPKGQIDIKVKSTKKFYEVSMKDSGDGIPPDLIEIVFSDRPNLSIDGTAKEKGFGLGLRICKEFVAKMNGEIKVKSALGKGSTFTFTVPVYQ